jgi:hypothetical protein
VWAPGAHSLLSVQCVLLLRVVWPCTPAAARTLRKSTEDWRTQKATGPNGRLETTFQLTTRSLFQPGMTADLFLAHVRSTGTPPQEANPCDLSFARRPLISLFGNVLSRGEGGYASAGRRPAPQEGGGVCSLARLVTH